MQHDKLLKYLTNFCKGKKKTEIFSWNLTFFSKDQIPEFEKKKILCFKGFADHVKCNRCHKGCTIELKDVSYPDGTLKKVSICSDLESYGKLEFEPEEVKCWQINEAKLPKPSNKETQKQKKTRKRATKKQKADRNRSVALAAGNFKQERGRLATVQEIMELTSYGQRQIYDTDVYKEGHIAKRTAKATDEITGRSICDSEYFGEKSVNHNRADRRSLTEQAQLDKLIDQQKQDQKSNYVL